MAFSLSLIQSISGMFIIIGLGFFLSKSNFVNEKESATMAKIALFVGCPAIIFKGFTIKYQPERIMGFGITALACLITLVLFSIMASGLGKTAKFSVIDQGSLIYTNCGNLLIPILSAILGDEAIFYLAAYVAVHQAYFFTHGVTLLEGKGKSSIRKILLNPNIIACFIGLIYFFVNGTLTPLPIAAPLSSAITNLGNLLTPLCMLVIGIQIGKSNIRETFTNKSAYIVTATRLLIFPLLLMGFIWISHITMVLPLTASVLLITVMAASAPTASSLVNYALIVNGDVKRASAVNILTVVFCIITIPFMAYIYQALFMK